MNLETLINAAKNVYGVDPLQKNRNLKTVWARQAIISKYEASLQKTGNALGIDYSTVHYHKKKIKSQIDFDPQFRELYKKFEFEILNVSGKVLPASSKTSN